MLLGEGGVRSVALLLHQRGPTGSGDLHQTASEIQSETQALHSVCMLLLHSNRPEGGEVTEYLTEGTRVRSRIQFASWE